jgi:hypothetical protein
VILKILIGMIGKFDITFYGADENENIITILALSRFSYQSKQHY